MVMRSGITQSSFASRLVPMKVLWLRRLLLLQLASTETVGDVVRAMWSTSQVAIVMLLALVGLKPKGLVVPLRMGLNHWVHYVDPVAHEFAPLLEIYHHLTYLPLQSFQASPGQVVVDIGANIGGYSFWQAAHDADIYACEPNKECWRRFLKAIVQNKLVRRVRVLNVAVSDYEGYGRLVPPSGSNKDYTPGLQLQLSSDPDDECRVQVVTLDGLVEHWGLQHIDILKIDAECSEPSILTGGQQALEMTSHVIMECHSPVFVEVCAGLLVHHGFSCFEFQTAGSYSIVVASK